jgi:hypothetical protein
MPVRLGDNPEKLLFIIISSLMPRVFGEFEEVNWDIVA